jgi:type IV pilus assembly protein PilY1
MIAFGPPNETDNSVRNRWIQEVLLSTRPYGATPIAGQLDDARQFLLNDTSSDPLDTAEQFGPSNDPNWRASNCRKSILILLTDGEPNLDLRPFCTATPDPGGTAGHCPYDKPETIVAALKDSAPQASMSVETYVVGFALAHVTPAGSASEIACSALTDAQCSDPLNNVPEQTSSKNIQACCTLNKIAAAGGVDSDGNPRKAHFAENPTELKAIFTDILDDVIQVATRTLPVFSSPGGDTASKGYKFFSAFDPQPDPSSPQLWEGVLERRRYVCSDALVPQLQYDPTDGDDFAANLNSRAGTERQFYTVIGDDDDNVKSIRPFLSDVVSDDDGLGTAGGEQRFAERPSDLPGRIPATAMQVPASKCTGASTPSECRDRIIKHLVGVSDGANPTRCPASGCELFGGIYHSVPTAVSGRPSELLRDESYESFAAEMAGIARPSVLYTSTVDGFLHAFNLAPFPNSDHAEEDAVDSKEDNELWSFIPPAVVPVLQTQYPSAPTVLLDGVPIIKDVVATKTGEGDDAVVKSYERVASDAIAGGGFWRTVLVEGFDSPVITGGYFALDITQPSRGDGQKPTFRWQLTQDSSGHALFGTGGTPLITTVYLGDNTIQKEVAVAVLPGGEATPGGPTGTAPDVRDVLETDPSTFKSGRAGRDYAGSEAARSLTIVRLDTGAVLRTFRPLRGSFSTTAWKEATNIPAPITGQPKAFPETTGAVADRIYVGDRDGRMWRVDVSSQNPQNWEMKVLYDAFEEGDSSASQPVVLPPVLSVDDVGDVTLAYATGSQELDNTQNRVISLTERLDDDKNFIAHVNWIHDLDVGDRVTGPMVLFNRALYYSVSHPPATTGTSCDVGSSKVYGAHYIESEDFATATENGDDPDPTTGPAKAPSGSALEITRQAGLVFGLSLEQEPTCVSAEEAVSGNDSFGYGEVKMSQQVNPGRYFLSFDASGNNTGSDGRGVLEVRQQLTSPQLPVTFQSWAVVYE